MTKRSNTGEEERFKLTQYTGKAEDKKASAAPQDDEAEKLYQEAIGLQFNEDHLDTFYPEAVKLYRQAAEKGHVGAQYKVADLFSRGYEAIDFDEAFKWCEMAAEKGHDGAVELLEDLTAMQEAAATTNSAKSAEVDQLKKEVEKERR